MTRTQKDMQLSSIPEVHVGVHYGRVNVVTPDGKPLAGVDVLVNGKVVLIRTN